MDDVADPAVQLAGFFATSRAVKCQFEPSTRRFSLILPKAARKIGVVPNSGFVALFASGDLFEVWPKEDFLKHKRGLGATLLEMGEAVVSDEEDE